MPRQGKPPSYRRRTIRGREVAYTTLRDAVTGRTKDFWLGDYGSEDSRPLYARLLAKWENNARRLWDGPRSDPLREGGPTVTQICHAYAEDQLPRYSGSHQSTLKADVKSFRAVYGDLPAAEIGPNS
ncbi:MAG: hypothetical protein ACKVS9_03895, partial [Phycisphaerae bacterium]